MPRGLFRTMLTNRQRYIFAYYAAKENEKRERDIYYGIPNCDQSFDAFVENGPSIEDCAVSDFLDDRFCPPE